MLLLFVSDVSACVAHCNDADQQANGAENAGTDPDDSARREARSENAAHERRGREAEVAGCFVQTEHQSASPRPGQIDLHDHGH